MTTVVDTFDRADSATSLGTTSDGSTTWSTDGSVWGISSNMAYRPTSGGNNVAYLDSGMADCTIQCVVNGEGLSSATFGVVFRRSASGSFWIAGGDGFNGHLYKVTGGSFGSVATFGWDYRAGNPRSVEVDLAGTSITVKVNGSTVASVTDSQGLTATQHGLYSEDTTGRFDGFSASDVVAPARRPQRPLVLSRAISRAAVI